MSLSKKIVGMHYRHPDRYEVEREKVREHAAAVKHEDPWYFDDDVARDMGYRGLPAPITFVSARQSRNSRLGVRKNSAISPRQGKSSLSSVRSERRIGQSRSC